MNAGTASGRTAHTISREIIGAVITVHSVLGPGLLENAYETCLAYELRQAGFMVATQVPLSLVYRGVHLDAGYRLDLLVEDCVVVEVKAVDNLAPVHSAQIISYLKLSRKPLGLLINFHVAQLRHGIKRFVLGTDWK